MRIHLPVVLMLGCVGEFPAPPAAIVDAAPIVDARQVTPDAAVPMDARSVDQGPAADRGPDAQPRPDMAAPAVDALVLDQGPRDARAADATTVLEACNGDDDDGDGLVDEGRTCGQFIVDACQLDVARSPGRLGSRGTWEICLDSGSADVGVHRCARGRADAWATVISPPNAEDTARIGIAFRCDGSPVGAWIQSRCAVFLGFGREPVGEAGRPDWGRCPQAIGRIGDWRCASTEGTGLFHALVVPETLSVEDWLAVAFRCADPADPLRAQSVTGSVAVAVGWATGEADDVRDLVGAERWGPCPPALLEWDNARRCNTSRGAGGFHAVPAGDSFGPNAAMGLRLLRRP